MLMIISLAPTFWGHVLDVCAAMVMRLWHLDSVRQGFGTHVLGVLGVQTLHVRSSGLQVWSSLAVSPRVWHVSFFGGYLAGYSTLQG